MDLIDKILLEGFVTKRVKSSNIKKVSYDKAEHILRLEFHSGGIYEYLDVPPSVYNRLMKAKSKGRFGYRNIYWDYDYERLN